MQTLLKKQDVQIGIQGGLGSYHEQAALMLGVDEQRLVGVDTFAELYEEVRRGRLQGAIVAIANNSVGIISPSYNELVYNDGVWICGETYVRVEHQLLGLPGSKLGDITEVRSQAPALGQCDANLARYLPKAIRVERNDTAASAKEVGDKKLKHVAAIASARAGELYGLETLVPNIQDKQHNITRFLVIQPRAFADTPKGANRTTMMLDTPQKSGSLAKVLGWFAERGINLSNLQSTFIPDSPFHMRFFLEFDAGVKDTRVEDVLAKLLSEGYGIQILGSYVSAAVPMQREEDA